MRLSRKSISDSACVGSAGSYLLGLREMLDELKLLAFYAVFQCKNGIKTIVSKI